jgi:hypothetical protein
LNQMSGTWDQNTAPLTAPPVLNHEISLNEIVFRLVSRKAVGTVDTKEIECPDPVLMLLPSLRQI